MNKFMLHTFLKIHITFNPSDIQLNNHTRPFSDMHYYSNSWIWLPFNLEVLAVFPSEYQHKIFSNSHENIFWKPCMMQILRQVSHNCHFLKLIFLFSKFMSFSIGNHTQDTSKFFLNLIIINWWLKLNQYQFTW